MGRLVVEISAPLQVGVLATYADINFLHFALFLFLVCTSVLLVVSMMTAPPDAPKVSGLTFATVEPVERTETDIRSRKRDLILTVGLLLCVGMLWVYFS